MHGVIETPRFILRAAEAGLSEEDRLAIISTIAADPKQGELMPGTGGCRKLRWAMPGKGKRGSWRTIHYYAGDDVPVIMLTILSKNQRADIPQAEKNALRKELDAFVDDYRRSVRARASTMRRRRR